MVPSSMEPPRRPADGRGSPAVPFVLAAPGETLRGYGVERVLPFSPGLSVAERAARHFAAAAPGGAPLLVGALPFDTARPAHLFQPRSLLRSWARGAPAGDRGEPRARHPARWRVEAEPPRAEYARAVARVLERMARDPALQKVVLARTLVLRATAPIDPRALVPALMADPAVTAFCIPLPDPEGARALVGATPELLVGKTGGRVVSAPLAGSAPRRADPGADREAAAALLLSEKDLREHAAVVEWIADRLAPFCRALRVPRSPSLVSTASLWHLGTRIEGELRDGDTPSLALAAALHPTPAVCGMPRAAAESLIGALEGFDRGYFGGAVGWCDATGDGAWHVAIRCAEVRGREARLYAGAGIVRGSDPALEAEETSAKFGAMLRALGIDEEGRTRGEGREGDGSMMETDGPEERRVWTGSVERAETDAAGDGKARRAEAR